MKIGTVQLVNWWRDRDPSEHYREAVEQMIAADELGLYSCWIVEHHFPRPSQDTPAMSLSIDPMTFLSHVAGRTKNIKLGTGVMVLQWDNPLRIAERGALLDILSGGRLELGVGRGGSVFENRIFKAPSDHSRERFKEAIDVIVAAWTQERLTYHGDFYEFDDVPVYPKPLQKPRPTIYIAAVSPESFDWVGRLGLPFCYVGATWEPVEKGTFKLQKDWYEAGAQEAGQDVSSFANPSVLNAYCAETDEEAMEVALEYLPIMIRTNGLHYEREKYADAAAKAYVDKAQQFPQFYSKLKPPYRPITDADRKKFVREMAEHNLIGSPATIIRKLKEFEELIDLKYLLMLKDWVPHNMVLSSMELIAKKVLPEFAEARPSKVSSHR